MSSVTQRETQIRHLQRTSMNATLIDRYGMRHERFDVLLGGILRNLIVLADVHRGWRANVNPSCQLRWEIRAFPVSFQLLVPQHITMYLRESKGTVQIIEFFAPDYI